MPGPLLSMFNANTFNHPHQDPQRQHTIVKTLGSICPLIKVIKRCIVCRVLKDYYKTDYDFHCEFKIINNVNQ